MALVVGVISGCVLFGLWLVLRPAQPRPSATALDAVLPTPATVRPSPGPDQPTPGLGSAGAQLAAPAPLPTEAPRPAAPPSAVAERPVRADPTDAAVPAPAASSSPSPAPVELAAPAASSPTPPSAQASASPVVPPSERAARVARRIEDVLTDVVPDASAVVLTEVGGEPIAVRRDGDARRVAASTIKLPILLEVLRAERRGELDLSRGYTIRSSDVVGGTGELQGQAGRTVPLGEIVRLMIVRSDNVGTNVLLRQLGDGDAATGMARVNRLMADLGYRATRVQRTMLDTAAQQRGLENYVSADELASILEGARRDTLLPEVRPSISDRVLALLRERGERDREWLGLRLDAGWSLAHINGTLDAVRNDAGIIAGPAGREAIVVICQDTLTNPARGEQRIAEAAAKIQAILGQE